jgi:uncharacterized protein YbjT (DUF2867 family)
MTEQVILLAGATGLVGAAALDRMLGREPGPAVVAVGRRPPPRSHPRLRAVVGDFSRLGAEPPIPARAALCALGTTLAKAGSPEAFRAVDHDAVLAFARWAREGGAGTFVLVSSVGADPAARNLYLRVKGEAERDVGALGFSRLVILRPSLLLGPRAERRPGEAVARALAPLVNPLLRGPLRRYRGIAAGTVAAALVAAAEDDAPGTHVWDNDAIEAAAR